MIDNSDVAAASQACVNAVFAGNPTLDEVQRRLEAARTKPEKVRLSVLSPELAELVKAVIFHPDCPQDLIDGIEQGCWNVDWSRICDRNIERRAAKARRSKRVKPGRVAHAIAA